MIVLLLGGTQKSCLPVFIQIIQDFISKTDDESTNAHILWESDMLGETGIKNSEIRKKQELDLSEFACF